LNTIHLGDKSWMRMRRILSRIGGRLSGPHLPPMFDNSCKYNLLSLVVSLLSCHVSVAELSKLELVIVQSPETPEIESLNPIMRNQQSIHYDPSANPQLLCLRYCKSNFYWVHQTIQPPNTYPDWFLDGSKNCLCISPTIE
jgi:hypothetical protein